MVSEKKKESEQKQFAAEMELLMDVFHPNICRLLAVSIDAPKRCLVLQMCPAGSLFGVLDAERVGLGSGGGGCLPSPR